MRQRVQISLIWGLTLAVILALPAAGFAQALTGRDEYISSCGACHGRTAQGDGPLAEYFRNKPTNLTLLAHYNHGLFPEGKVRAMIDGRNVTGPHGAREMPVWGHEFVAQGSSHEQANARIKALIDFLKAIQEK
jgi:mono/diheme cytochrome c family protein